MAPDDAQGHDVGDFPRTLALPEAVEHWSLTTLREKLIKIGAKVVRHGRTITFQMGQLGQMGQMGRSPYREPCSLRFCAWLTGF